MPRHIVQLVKRGVLAHEVRLHLALSDYPALKNPAIPGKKDPILLQRDAQQISIIGIGNEKRIIAQGAKPPSQLGHIYVNHKPGHEWSSTGLSYPFAETEIDQHRRADGDADAQQKP